MPTTKNKSFAPKPKPLRNSGTSTTLTSSNWRTSRRTNPSLLSLRREAEKINLQPWPKTTELSSWKGSVVHEVCVASGDRHYEDWKAWLAPCLTDQPDLETLAKAPEVRFQSIDAKLSNALRKVIDNAGDKSMQVKYDTAMKNQMYGKSGDSIKGRELFAMILISFKSPDHTEVLYNCSSFVHVQLLWR